MAILKQTSTFPTSFVVGRDIEDLVTLIGQAAGKTQPTSPLNVFFIGEAHNNDFDVRRRREVFDAFANHAKVIVAVERTLVSPGSASNLALENNDLKSADDVRNQQIVGMVQDLIEQKPAMRTVVFFYGQEHEHPICKHLLAALPATLGIDWVSCLPIEMSLKPLLAHQPSMFSTVGKRPVGYCENRGTDYLLRLLEKGYVHEPFTVDLYSGEQVGSLFTHTLYAIYVKNDTQAAHQRKAVISEGTSGVSIKRINGAYTTVAKVIKKEQVAAAEKGTLDV